MKNNAYEQDRNSAKLEDYNFLFEIASILFQVNDLSLALEMILDMISENFKITRSAVSIKNELLEEYQILKHIGFTEKFASDFVFHTSESIAGSTISSEQNTKVNIAGTTLAIGEKTLDVDPGLTRLTLLPLKYHEKLIGFLVLGSEKETESILDEAEEILSRFATLISPVIFSFDPVSKSSSSFESIVSKIIKDRVYEARLLLNPIAFSIFRLGFQEKIEDSLLLEDAVKSYQTEFRRLLSGKGDLVLLTTDTAFFMQPNADLFVAESLATELKDSLMQLCELNETLPTASLNYACISYPQSGENAIDIINSLWLKLFEEIYIMEH